MHPRPLHGPGIALLVALVACVGTPSAPPGPDADADGVVDADDFCPAVPGRRDASGCIDAAAVEDEQALRVLQAAEGERSREALQASQAFAARLAEEEAAAQAQRELEERHWRQELAKAEEESRVRAEVEERARAQAMQREGSDKDRERMEAERRAYEAQKSADESYKWAKDEETKARLMAQLEAAMKERLLEQKDPPAEDVTPGWVDPGDPLGGLEPSPNAGKPGYDAHGNPLTTSAPGPPPPPPPPHGAPGDHPDEGYGYEFNDDPLSAGGFGPNDATTRVRPMPSAEPSSPPSGASPNKNVTVYDFEDDVVEGNLERPDGTYLEARHTARGATPSTVTRFSYPTMEAPPFVKPRQPFDLRVSLTEMLRSTATRVDEGTTDALGRLAMELPADVATWSIDVEVSAPGFQVLGEPTGTIELGREGDSTTASFRLMPLDLPKPAPERRVFVSLWFEGNFLARLSRTLKVRETAPLPEPVAKAPEPVARPVTPVTPVPTDDAPVARIAAVPATRSADESAGGLDFEVTEVATVNPDEQRRTDDLRKKLGRPTNEPLIDARRSTPDLTIHLVADEAVPGRWSLYVANAHGFVPVRADVLAPADLDTWIAGEFKRFSSVLSRGARRRDTPAPAAAIAELKGFGRRLWSTHVPRAVQNLFWILHDTLGAELRAIQVYTNVASFPWELAKPWRRKADGTVEELDFLGIRYRVGRWHVGRDDAEQLPRPPQRQSLEAVTAVVPKYEGAEDLPAVKAEVAAISQLPLSSVVGGSRAELVKALDSAPRGIVHFAGHGVAMTPSGGNPSWAVKLEKDDLLQVREWRGLTPLQSPPRLFFVNACELGQSERVAGFVDGWAPALLDTGASAYIGGLWPLGDTGASEFARRFYAEIDRALLNFEPVRVADVLSKARMGLYENDDATFLGYVFYGDANLLLEP